MSKGERDFGMLTKWVSEWKPFMLRLAQHERLPLASTAVFRIICESVATGWFPSWSLGTRLNPVRVSKGERDFGMLTKWVSVWKPFMLRLAQHERLPRASTAVFRIIGYF